MKFARLLVEALGAMARYYPLLVLLLIAGIELGLAHVATSAHHHVLVESATVLLALSAVGLMGVPRFARLEMRRVSDIYSIDSMSGEQFEQRLAALFRAFGYSVSTTRATGDFGADLVLERDGTRTVVQAKRWDSCVGIEAVYEVVGAKAHYGAGEAVVVTNFLFTPAAVEAADDNGVALIERDELVQMLASQAAVSPPRTGLLLALCQVASGVRFLVGVVWTACVAVLGLLVAHRAYRRIVRHA
jgi:HJR/Mrr/RecB family endonuclease